MKKLALLITMLLLILSVAYAQVDLKPTVTGSAEVVWGLDLTDNSTGFTSSTSSSIALTLVSGSDTKGADADVYGSITLGGFGVSFSDTTTIDLTDATCWKDSDGNELTGIELALSGSTTDIADIDTDTLRTGLAVTKPTITAKIVLSPTMNLIIAGAPYIGYDKASVLNGTSVMVSEYETTAGGITLNVNAAPATINVMVLSPLGQEANSENQYAFAADVSMAVAPATISAYACMGVNYAANPIGLGGSVALDLGVLKPTLAADVKIGDATSWDFSASIPVTVAPLSLTASVSAISGDTIDLAAKVVAGVTAGGASVSLTATMINILVTDGLDVDLDLTASYVAGNITVSASTGYDVGVVATADDETLYLTLQLDAALIPNTVFTAKYVSDEMLLNAYDNGVVTVGAKISY